VKSGSDAEGGPCAAGAPAAADEADGAETSAVAAASAKAPSLVKRCLGCLAPVRQRALHAHTHSRPAALAAAPTSSPPHAPQAAPGRRAGPSASTTCRAAWTWWWSGRRTSGPRTGSATSGRRSGVGVPAGSCAAAPCGGHLWHLWLGGAEPAAGRCCSPGPRWPGPRRPFAPSLLALPCAHVHWRLAQPSKRRVHHVHVPR
jgi:hypothetical protein